MDWACLAVFPPCFLPTIWVSVYVCVSNREVCWGLLTDVVVIGRGSQDVSEPLTCPLALSTPLSPHIDHPATHHWSGKPGTSALLRHTLRLSRLLSVLPIMCMCERERGRVCQCLCEPGRAVVVNECASTCVFYLYERSTVCFSVSVSGHTHLKPFITYTKGPRNLKAHCYIISPIIQMYSTFQPLCCDIINNVHSSISGTGSS